MVERAQRGPTNPREQLPKRRVARQVGPEDEGVDEKADETFRLGVGTAGRRRPHREVHLPAVPRE
jgi:hypothetical protein